MKSPYKKYLYIGLGLIFLGLAYVGIALPGVPAIPFILLAAWFFLQGSDRLYQWMARQRYIGKVLTRFMSGEQPSKKAIWFVISQLWVSLIVAQIILRPDLNTILIINASGIVASILIYKLLLKINGTKRDVKQDR
jgi:uncharacterized membrane protein YbaN (DUF454 family)